MVSNTRPFCSIPEESFYFTYFYLSFHSGIIALPFCTSIFISEVLFLMKKILEVIARVLAVLTKQNSSYTFHTKALFLINNTKLNRTCSCCLLLTC